MHDKRTAGRNMVTQDLSLYRLLVVRHGDEMPELRRAAFSVARALERYRSLLETFHSFGDVVDADATLEAEQ
jgi:hypothetical protein